MRSNSIFVILKFTVYKNYPQLCIPIFQIAPHNLNKADPIFVKPNRHQYPSRRF